MGLIPRLLDWSYRFSSENPNSNFNPDISGPDLGESPGRSASLRQYRGCTWCSQIFARRSIRFSRESIAFLGPLAMRKVFSRKVKISLKELPVVSRSVRVRQLASGHFSSRTPLSRVFPVDKRSSPVRPPPRLVHYDLYQSTLDEPRKTASPNQQTHRRSTRFRVHSTSQLVLRNTRLDKLLR